jgi:hypothetical protein
LRNGCAILVEVTIGALRLQVHQGRLITVDAGHSAYRVTLRCEDIELGTREGDLDTAATLRLRSGIILVPRQPNTVRLVEQTVN